MFFLKIFKKKVPPTPVADNAQIWRQKVLAGTLWPPPSFQFRGTVLGLPKRVGIMC
jgi:hypothetical protein